MNDCAAGNTHSIVQILRGNKQMLLSAKWTGRQTFNLEIRVRSSVGVPNNAVTCHHEDGAANIPVNVAAGIFKELITLHARAGSLPVLPHQIKGR